MCYFRCTQAFWYTKEKIQSATIWNWFIVIEKVRSYVHFSFSISCNFTLLIRKCRNECESKSHKKKENRSWFWVVIIATLNIINNDFDTRQIQKTNTKIDEKNKKKRNTGSKLPTLIGPVETISNKQISMRRFYYIDAFKWQASNEQK